MIRFVAALGCCLLLGSVVRPADNAPADAPGAYLGVLFGPVPAALYDQLPQLPRDQGVLVTQVLSDSPAEKTGLRRNDVLLRYGDKVIHDCDDLVRFLQADAPGRAVRLTLLRGGKETTADAALALGPAIKTAQEAKSAAGAADVAPGVAKPGGPATVSVAAAPLERGRLKVTIEYYPDGQSRPRSVTCEGQPDEIAGQVEKEGLSEREKSMVRVALRRIQMLNAPKASGTP